MSKLLWVAGFAGLVASLAGLLVVVWPFFELANHFRPFIVMAAMVLAALSVLAKQRIVGLLALGLIVFNALLLLPGLLNRAAFAPAANNEPAQLKILTFNIWIGNRAMDDVAHVLLREDADIVALQEVTGWQFEQLSKRLGKRYPHKVSCAHKRSCLLAVFSKRALSNVKVISRGGDNPPLITANILNPKGQLQAHFLATHISWPFHPYKQRADMNWLAAYIFKRKHPFIVAGDFNLSPWSWKMARFQKTTGLRSHTSYMFSWPAHRLIPFVQLDHILTSPHFKTVIGRTGNKAGSDHLPVVATLSMPLFY